ncbi:MAG: AzlC family ABC transporter permease [Acidimicrobiia bacterium]|nr:AzlC family ABC transporter permease [Acidimicrobiia bacterium]
MIDRAAFGRGVRRSLGICTVVAGFGVLYGVVATAAGMPGWVAIASSFVVLSGAAQFTSVALLGIGAGPGALIVAVSGLALRHLPMAAALRRVLGPAGPAKRALMAYVLTDETFGLTLTAAQAGEEHPGDFLLGANATLLTGWAGGTAVGVVFGAVVDPAALGLGVLLPLLFLGLAGDHLHDLRHLGVAAVAVAASALSVLVVPGPWRITAAAFGTAAIAALFPGPDA